MHLDFLNPYPTLKLVVNKNKKNSKTIMEQKYLKILLLLK